MQFRPFVIVLLFTFIGESAAMLTIDSSMIKGMSLLQEKEYKKAILEFDNCINQKSNYAAAYFQRGTCNLLLNKHNIALVDFNQALRLDSSLYEAYYNRALAEHAIKNFTFAEADFLLYKNRVPKDDRVIKNLALLMEDMQEFNLAISYHTEYMQLHPNDFESLKSRAMLNAEVHSIDLAIADLDICLRPDANDTSIWMCKGNIFYDAQRFAEAIDAYNVILLLYPDNKAALYNRADAYTSLKRYDEAIRDYLFLSSKDKYNSEYYFNIGFCNLQLGKNQESILSFGKALDTDYLNLGLLLMLRGVAYNNLALQGEACSDWQKSLELGCKEAQKYRAEFCK